MCNNIFKSIKRKQNEDGKSSKNYYTMLYNSQLNKEFLCFYFYMILKKSARGKDCCFKKKLVGLFECVHRFVNIVS